MGTVSQQREIFNSAIFLPILCLMLIKASYLYLNHRSCPFHSDLVDTVAKIF